MTENEKLIIGCVESCSLEQLGISDMDVRIDTGAKTSSLHVDNIKKYVKDGVTRVQFDIHPNSHDVEQVMTCHAKVTDIRRIKSSNGKSEQRYVIKTPIKLGKLVWEIEITLTNRSDMSYLMLLGREGLDDKFLVDASSAYLL